MDAVTVLTWLAAGEGEHTEFKEKYNSRVIEASPYPGAARDRAGRGFLATKLARGAPVGRLRHPF